MTSESVLSFSVSLNHHPLWLQSQSEAVMTQVHIWETQSGSDFQHFWQFSMDPTLMEELLPFVVRWDSLAEAPWRIENMMIGSMVAMIRCCVMADQTVSRASDMDSLLSRLKRALAFIQQVATIIITGIIHRSLLNWLRFHVFFSSLINEFLNCLHFHSSSPIDLESFELFIKSLFR